MVEEYGLVPSNHLGRKKHRSAVQALVILQEQIWKAWQSRKILILVGFDIKGAYNGVSKIRLLRRLAARRIPQQLIAWVDNFCSERTATITVFFFFHHILRHLFYPQQLTKMQRPFGYKEAI